MHAGVTVLCKNKLAGLGCQTAAAAKGILLNVGCCCRWLFAARNDWGACARVVLKLSAVGFG